jgi:hypothetical protein
MLEVFADGYFQAMAALSRTGSTQPPPKDRDEPPSLDPDLPELLDL